MVDYPSFSVSVWSLNFKKLNRNCECQAKTEGSLLFFGNVYRKSNCMNNMVFASLKKSMNDSRAQAGPPNFGNSYRYVWVTQSPSISLPPTILILVFPQSATWKTEVYIVWRARDGQVGEGIIEVAHPSSAWATLCLEQYIQKHLLFLPFKVCQETLTSILKTP